MSNTKPYEGQLPIPFDGMDVARAFSSLTVREKVLESPEEYLKRGERLVTLAKQHLQETTCKKAPSMLEAVYDMSLDLTKKSPRECMIKLRNIVGGYLRTIKEEGDDSCKALQLDWRQGKHKDP